MALDIPAPLCDAASSSSSSSFLMSPYAAPHSQADKVGFLFGHHITNSLSPLLLSTVFHRLSLPWSYTPIDSTALERFLAYIRTEKRFYGSAITMPHKVAVIPLLDDLTDEARRIGAVNTIFLGQTGGHGHDPSSRKTFIGANTDCVGIRQAFIQNSNSDQIKGKPGLVVGAGGASRSAVYAMHEFLGCNPIYIINRDAGEAHELIMAAKAGGFGDNLVYVESPDHAARLQAPHTITVCVPNYTPKSDGEINVRKSLELFLRVGNGVLLEMCYHPVVWTDVCQMAKREGWEVILGTEPLIWQGLEQVKLWTGRELDQVVIEEAKTAIMKALSKARL